MLGEVEHFAGRSACTQHVIQEEVMHNVRAQNILGQLDNLSGCRRRQQLRADSGLDNAVEILAHRLVCFVVCIPGDNILDQRLRNARIHAVHRHMVAVIGTPAQRQLGQVARADDNPAVLVGEVHQNLGTLAGLYVLVCQVMHLGVVADVREMLEAGRLDVNDLHRGAECLDQAYRVVVRAAGRAEARHCDRQHITGRTPEQLHSPHGNQQRKRRVEAAGDADHSLLGADVADALHQTGGLDRENLLAAFVPLERIARHERVDAYASFQLPPRAAAERRSVENLAVIASALAGPERSHHGAGILAAAAGQCRR